MDQIVGFESASTRRGTIDIIYSCVSTLIICVWTTVRPNVYPEDTTLWRRLRDKAGWTLLTIMFPEFMLFKAVVLFFHAKEAMRRVNEYHERNSAPERTRDMMWTLRDGFFARMHGFTIEGDVVNDERIVALMESKEIPPVRSYDREIRDRSKTDGFAQLVACLQALFLAIQCITRKAEGLPLSLLELGTLAYVLLSIFIFGFLWLAPKDVETNIAIFRRWPSSLQDKRNDPAHDSTVSAGLVHALEEKCSPSRSELHQAEVGSSRRTPVLRRLLVALHRKQEMLCARLDSGASSSDNIKVHHPLVLLLFCGCIAWGVLHCLGWRFHFPSTAEKWLWRICSIMSTIGPWIHVQGVIKAFHVPRKNWGFDGWLCVILIVFALINRLALLIVMFITLRSMPSDVYENVQWPSFVPHL